MATTKRMRIEWAISRLRRMFRLWDAGLDSIDKEYALRRIRDNEPYLFWKIAYEERGAR
jgi:hypothetical protein